MQEIWKLYPGAPYEVSNLGEVRNTSTGHILSQNINSGGYNYVSLHKPVKYNLTVSRAVAFLFVPNPDNKPQVNHIDGIKSNNDFTNLEWVTQEENLAHAVRTGLMPCGSTSYLAKLNESKVEQIKLDLCAGVKVSVLAKKYNVHAGTISGINNRRTWKHVRPDLYW